MHCLQPFHFAGFAQGSFRPLTTAEIATSTATATAKTNSLQAPLSLTTAEYPLVLDAETTYQEKVDRYSVNGITPIPAGALSNITTERDNAIKQALTPAQYVTYMSIPH